MTDITRIAAALREGRISRRSFMSRALAAGLAAPAATALADRALAATPKRGGRLRLGTQLGSSTDSLDPATYEDTFMQVTGFGLRNCLTEISGEDELVPELAESWEASPDATEWRFTLREGVTFHSGKTLDAGDVVASILHHMGPESKSPARGILAPVAEVVADGPRRVIFRLDEGNADFPFLMSDYHLAICPVKNGKLDWQSGDGTGGYVLESFEPGIRAFMTHNPNYWKPDAAWFDETEILALPDTAARTSALAGGKVDVIDRVDLKTANRLASTPGLRLEETQGTLHYAYSMRIDREPFDDVDVRLALKYAIDREELLDKLLFGHGYIGNDHPIGRSNRYFAADLEQHSYDPDRARHHLRKAGREGLEVSLHAANTAFDGAIDGAVLFQQKAARAGITLDVVREPNDGYWANVWKKRPFFASYWAGRVTEDWVFSQTYAEGLRWNETNWANPRFNELLKTARAELDEAKRREMYHEMQRLCRDDGGAIIPLFANYVFAMREGVRHGRMSGAWDLDGIKCLERWWFA